MAERFKFQATAPTELQSSYDVVVIGAGGAGLVAALQAVELGLKPVVLEKMAKVGGNTNRASSGMNASETSVQLHQRIIDSNQAFFNETLVGGGGFNDQELLGYFTTHGAAAIEWLNQHAITLDDLTITGGMTVKRTHRPQSTAPIGNYLIQGLLRQLAQQAVPVFVNSRVTDLNRADTGAITGVQVLVDGRVQTIQAPTVILAAGGFGASQKLIKAYRPDLAHYQTTNQPGATGDGLELAQATGADLVAMDQIQVHPTVQQDTDHPYLIGEAVRGEGAILVDQNGQRFVNELATRKQVTAAINQLPDQHAYLLFDQAIRSRVKAIEFYDHIGLVLTGTDLPSLADQAHLDSERLTATVAQWNQHVADQRDADFGRTTGMTQPISSSPYYLIHIAPAVHYTMGGVHINAKAEVLNVDKQVIPGLYAAGEVTGGLHGNNRIGGNSIAETVIFGRQAAQQVCRYLQTH